MHKVVQARWRAQAKASELHLFQQNWIDEGAAVRVPHGREHLSEEAAREALGEPAARLLAQKLLQVGSVDALHHEVDGLGHLDDVCAKEGPSGIANLCSGRLARNM